MIPTVTPCNPRYTWLGVWYLTFCFDQIYIKHTVETVKMESNW